jgi:tRNA dimethylallyltransferase
VSLVVISGPTASGKSHLADWVYNKFSAKIINADSIQVYDALPILTAQPGDLKNIAHKYSLYATFQYDDKCTLAKWVKLVAKEIEETIAVEKTPILVGGTGLYIKALLEGVVDVPDVDESVRNQIRSMFCAMGKERFYTSLLERDPGIIAKVHANDTTRMIRAMEVFEQTGKSILSFKDKKKKFYDGQVLHLSLYPEREMLYQWCEERFDKMLQVGMIDEVAQFVESTNAFDRNFKYPVEYALGCDEIMQYISGNMPLEDAKVSAKQKTRNYAKRQVTWFRHQFSDYEALRYSEVEELIKGAEVFLSEKL